MLIRSPILLTSPVVIVHAVIARYRDRSKAFPFGRYLDQRDAGAHGHFIKSRADHKLVAAAISYLPSHADTRSEVLTIG